MPEQAERRRNTPRVRGYCALRTSFLLRAKAGWIVEVIAPFGGAEEMIKDLKANVFPTREISYLALTPDGKKDVRVCDGNSFCLFLWVENGKRRHRKLSDSDEPLL